MPNRGYHLAWLLLLLVFAFSAPGYTACTTVTIPVDVTAQNAKFVSPPDLSNEAAVLMFLRNATANAHNGTQTVRSRFTLHGTYCRPAALLPRNALQVLVHGITYNRTYWTGFGMAEAYDYPAFANSNGYHTLALDRVGHGENTEHPDPVHILQTALHVEALHQVIDSLRTCRTPLDRLFSSIIYVGHSYGSVVGTGLAAAYPADADALVLTGQGRAYAPVGSGLDADLAAAHVVLPSRDASLMAGYLSFGHKATIEASFFAGDFDPAVPAVNFDVQDTVTPGELLTFSAATRPALGFAKPVLLINGMNDTLLCNVNVGSCLHSLESGRTLFPNTSQFDVYAPPATGHNVNLHLSAPDTNAVIHEWLDQFF